MSSVWIWGRHLSSSIFPFRLLKFCCVVGNATGFQCFPVYFKMTRTQSAPALQLILFCCLASVLQGQSALPVLLVRADHYHAGFVAGRTFEKQIQEYYRLHPSLRSKYVPWVQSGVGKKVYDEYVQVSNSTFPHYTLEMLGIAEGANVSFQEVFLINIMRELDAFLANNKSVDSCSDVFVNATYAVGYCHNEDTSPLIGGRGYITDAELYFPGSPHKIVEKFTFYTYPGTLPGNAFGFNGHGLTFSVDALYPKEVMRKKIPRNVLTRAMIAAESMEDLQRILNRDKGGSAYAASINVGDTSSGMMYNIEVGPDKMGPGSLFSMYTVGSHDKNLSNNYFHVNKFRRLLLPEIPKHIISSEHRSARIKQLFPADNFSKVRGILGDTTDRKYPIYRKPSSSDNALTVATACYDLQKKKMDIYMGNPKSSDIFHTFPIGKTL